MMPIEAKAGPEASLVFPFKVLKLGVACELKTPSSLLKAPRVALEIVVRDPSPITPPKPCTIVNTSCDTRVRGPFTLPRLTFCKNTPNLGQSI